MEQLRYENRMEFGEDSVGKLVVTKESDLVRLFGKSEKAPYSLAECSPEEVRMTMEELTQSFGEGTQLDKLVGQHAEIPVEGKPIGGAEFAYSNGILYLTGSSGKFGGLYEEAVRRCVGDNQKIEDIGLVTPGFGFGTYEDWISE